MRFLTWNRLCSSSLLARLRAKRSHLKLHRRSPRLKEGSIKRPCRTTGDVSGENEPTIDERDTTTDMVARSASHDTVPTCIAIAKKTGIKLEFNFNVTISNEDHTEIRLVRNSSPSIPGRSSKRGHQVIECSKAMKKQQESLLLSRASWLPTPTSLCFALYHSPGKTDTPSDVSSKTTTEWAAAPLPEIVKDETMQEPGVT